MPLLISLAILLPLTIPAGRALRVLELGDDAAHALGRAGRAHAARAGGARGRAGVGQRRGRGPIGFVALTAPQIARRLARSCRTAAAVLGADRAW